MRSSSATASRCRQTELIPVNAAVGRTVAYVPYPPAARNFLPCGVAAFDPSNGARTAFGRFAQPVRRGEPCPTTPPRIPGPQLSQQKSVLFNRLENLRNFDPSREPTQRHRCRLALLKAGAGEPVLVPVSPLNPGAISIPHTSRHPLLAATVNFPFMATQIFSLLGLPTRCRTGKVHGVLWVLQEVAENLD